MAKNFPFFKFVATEWLTGDIVFEELSTQGLFINICALYWQRDGKLSLQDINKRYKTIIVDNLIDRFFTVIDGNISISFLDEQLIDAGHISKVNSENGKKGAEAKRIKANAKKCSDKEFVEELSKFKETYSKDILNSFYRYWSEKDDKGKTKMSLEKTFEVDKRLITWSTNDKKFNKVENKIAEKNIIW
jgi:hypothetical protein